MLDPNEIWSEFCALVAADQGLDEVPTQWTRETLFIGGLVGDDGKVLDINWTDFMSIEFAVRRKWEINLPERNWQTLLSDGTLGKMTLGTIFDEVVQALSQQLPA